MIIGATFCRVIRTKHCIHDRPCITIGNQKWIGAAPILSSKEVKINKVGVVLHIIKDVALVNIIEEPRAWTKKYFRAASEE